MQVISSLKSWSIYGEFVLFSPETGCQVIVDAIGEDSICQHGTIPEIEMRRQSNKKADIYA